MALKRQFDMTALFSMASMTDIIFLLLIFFMVTSTYVFPTALELNLPESSEQTTQMNSSVRINVYTDGSIISQFADESPVATPIEQLEAFLSDAARRNAPDQPFNIAIVADADVPYGSIVKILDIGARKGMKMVLATKVSPSAVEAASDVEAPVTETLAQ